METHCGPPAARYLDASSILIVREKTVYNKYVKMVSEYDQEIPQSQITDNPMAP